MGTLKILAAAAGFLLILKVPAFAQNPAEPQETAQASSGSASSAQDEGQSSTDARLDLTESDWWGENDGLSFGYLPGGYGLGLGSCGSWSAGTGRGAVQWWNAPSTNAWFPTGQQLPYPYGSGWCGNNGYGNRSPYALWVNRIIIPTNKHHGAWKHTPGNETNNQTKAQTQAAVAKEPRELDAVRDTPDDDWTRVDDHVEYPHTQQTAALQRQNDQGRYAAPRGRLTDQQARERQHMAQQQNLQRARAEKMQALGRRRAAQTRAFAPMRMSGSRPAPAHIAARSGGHGHS